MLSGPGRSSFTPGLECCSHASVFCNEFLCFYEHILQVPSCWVLACVWACSVTATEKLNKQLGSETGSLGLCNRHPWKNGNESHTGWVGKYSTAGKQAEFNKWKLLLHLDSTSCQLFSVSAWQSSPAPKIWHTLCFPVSWLSPQPLTVFLGAMTGFSGFCLVFPFALRGGCHFQT